jgi:predicted CoA-substrate-specific enzyme activase
MYYAGIDIGSSTSKAVILKENEIIASNVIDTGPDSRNSANEAINSVLDITGLGMEDLKSIVATGYGRVNVAFANGVKTEIACHAKGVHSIFPNARTVLDMGGQDCKAIKIDESGNHVSFAMNDKCAAGTGRFLEIMSDLLKIPLDQIGPFSLQATEDTRISNICTVFAKSEASRHLRRGVPKENILGGLHMATSERVISILKRVGIENDFVISGGIAKNSGVVKRIEKIIGMPAFISQNPQIIGALGAALYSQECT